MGKFLAIVVLGALAGCASYVQTGDSALTNTTMKFEYLGCSKALSLGDSYETVISREEYGTTTTFQVRHAATCGLDVRRPAYSVSDGKLVLTYEMYSKNGGVVMCDCSYSSRFTFSNLPGSVESTSFAPIADER